MPTAVAGTEDKGLKAAGTTDTGCAQGETGPQPDVAVLVTTAMYGDSGQ